MSINLVSGLSAVHNADEVLDVPLLVLVSPLSYLRFFQDLWRDDSPRLGTILCYCPANVLDVFRLGICDLRVFWHFI